MASVAADQPGVPDNMINCHWCWAGGCQVTEVKHLVSANGGLAGLWKYLRARHQPALLPNDRRFYVSACAPARLPSGSERGTPSLEVLAWRASGNIEPGSAVNGSREDSDCYLAPGRSSNCMPCMMMVL